MSYDGIERATKKDFTPCFLYRMKDLRKLGLRLQNKCTSLTARGSPCSVSAYAEPSRGLGGQRDAMEEIVCNSTPNVLLIVLPVSKPKFKSHFLVTLKEATLRRFQGLNQERRRQ